MWTRFLEWMLVLELLCCGSWVTGNEGTDPATQVHHTTRYSSRKVGATTHLFTIRLQSARDVQLLHSHLQLKHTILAYLKNHNVLVLNDVFNLGPDPNDHNPAHNLKLQSRLI